MNLKLVLALTDAKNVQDADFMLGHYSGLHDIFPDRWFLPGFVLDPRDNLSELQEMNRHTVKFFDMDFHLKSWGLCREVTLSDSKYDLVVLQGSLTNGKFLLNEKEKYYNAAWFGNDPVHYIGSREERDLFKEILKFEASK